MNKQLGPFWNSTTFSILIIIAGNFVCFVVQSSDITTS
uniref:Uncharacterized protein n=1 Tax=Arundo donax TaxID=35708 RepID=A0A0A8ZLC6_ARUDO